MKKQFKKFSVLFAAVALMASCSNDEPNPGNSLPENVKGMDAYLTVNIQDAGAMIGRDGDYTDGMLDDDVKNGDYEYGSAGENEVSNAKFYFYTADKVFMQEGTLTTFAPNGGTDDNVEVFGKKVLVLKGLTTNETPTYMVTILNAPSDFQPGATLADTQAAISDIQAVLGDKSYFVMSTTSFVDASYTDEYGTNKLNPTDFLVQPAGTVTPDNIFNTDETKSAVNVYVERLAAKVETRTAVAGEEDEKGNVYVPVTVSIAGNPNNIGGADATLSKVYVKLSKWGLTSVAKQSYMIKNIAKMTAEEIGGWAWNDPTRFRSYWGHSLLWGQNVTENNAKFISYNGATNSFGKYAYCPENTNELSKIAEKNLTIEKNLTSVLFTATVYEKVGDKFEALDMVNYNGALYRTEWFKDFALNYLNNWNKLNYYKKETKEGEPDKYIQFNADDLKITLESTGDGNVKLVSKVAADTEYYTHNGATYEQQSFDEAAIAKLNEALASFDNNNGKDVVANAYKDGMMRYIIPIEHLVKRGSNTDNIVEGNYGVVRNHWYLLTVDSIKRLGTGVFDPDEEIIPSDKVQDPTYYLGAKINILSWKIVTQQVEL